MLAPRQEGDEIVQPHILVLIPSLLIELAMIGSLAFTLYYTVHYRSGLQEPDKVRRIWSRISEIRLQPIPRTLLFSSIVSYGSNSVFTIVLAFLPVLLNFHFASHNVISALFWLVIAVGSCALAIVTYLVGGGSNWKTAVWGSAGVHLGMYYYYIFFADAISQIVEECHRKNIPITRGIALFTLYAFIPAMTVAMQFLLSCWVAYLNMPATARKIYNNSVVPNWVKLDRSIMIAAVPLAVVHLASLLIQSLVGYHSYLARVAYYLSTLMVLAVSGLVSIISVNRALLANEFEWQWRAFLTPAIPLGCMDFVLTFILTVLGKGEGFFLGLLQVVRLFFVYGTCGALAAYVYLIVAEKYAQTFVDEDVAAQTDLLGEFADDDDNEELEV